jgi:hypothetical protein
MGKFSHYSTTRKESKDGKRMSMRITRRKKSNGSHPLFTRASGRNDALKEKDFSVN